MRICAIIFVLINAVAGGRLQAQETIFTVKKPSAGYFNGIYFSDKYDYREKFVEQDEDSANNHFYAPPYYTSNTVVKADSVRDVFIFDSTGQVRYLYTVADPGNINGTDVLNMDSGNRAAAVVYQVKNDTLMFVFNILPRVKAANAQYRDCALVAFEVIIPKRMDVLKVAEQLPCNNAVKVRNYKIYAWVPGR